jgi:hypothetical protein
MWVLLATSFREHWDVLEKVSRRIEIFKHHDHHSIALKTRKRNGKEEKKAKSERSTQGSHTSQTNCLILTA